MTHLPFITKKGAFTLAEVMVAILVMMVGMLGLLRMIDVILNENLRNQLRHEAVQVGERHMSELKGMPFEQISSFAPVRVQRRIRGGTSFYSVERSSQVLAADPGGPTSKQLKVVVKWSYRNITSQSIATSVVTP